MGGVLNSKNMDLLIEGERAIEAVSHRVLIVLWTEQFAPVLARLCELVRTRVFVLRAFIGKWRVRAARLVTCTGAPAPKNLRSAP